MDLRQIDALIAEHVMGWERKAFFGWSIVDPEISREPLKDALCPAGWDPGPPPRGMAILESHVPHYSTGIAAAWEVVEKLVADGREVQINTFGAPQSIVWACYIDDSRNMSRRDASAPLAICLAALKAKGIDVPEGP